MDFGNVNSKLWKGSGCPENLSRKLYLLISFFSTQCASCSELSREKSVFCFNTVSCFSACQSAGQFQVHPTEIRVHHTESIWWITQNHDVLPIHVEEWHNFLVTWKTTDPSSEKMLPSSASTISLNYIHWTICLSKHLQTQAAGIPPCVHYDIMPDTSRVERAAFTNFFSGFHVKRSTKRSWSNNPYKSKFCNTQNIGVVHCNQIRT